MLLKRGPLLQVERSSAPREREFLLFSDCLIWLANEESERLWNLGWSASTTGDGGSSNPQTPVKPGLVRNKSRSEAELNKSKSAPDDDTEGSSTPKRHSSVVPSPMRKSAHQPPPVPRRLASTGEERWVFKGQSSLVDMEVIVVSSREAGEERRFEVLSPEGSFVLYAGTCSLIIQVFTHLIL